MKPLIYAILIALILLIMTKQIQNYVFEDYFKAVFDKETDPTDIHKVIVDSGGVTKYGISDLADKIEDGKYFGEDIRLLTPERARQIYKANYFTPYAQLFVAYPNFALHVFDVSINSGVGKAKELVNKSRRNVKAILGSHTASPEGVTAAIASFAHGYVIKIISHKKELLKDIKDEKPFHHFFRDFSRETEEKDKHHYNS